MTPFTRMHGAGNSFVIVEKKDAGSEDYSELALALCSEKTGMKADGMMIICPKENDDTDFSMLFYNSDGTKGEMCGNGARCIARYGYEHGFAGNPESISFMTTAGTVTGKRITEERYEVRLNDPSVLKSEVTAKTVVGTFKTSYIELGNPGIPHAVVLTDEEDFGNLEMLRERGKCLRYAEVYPKGANVTFVHMLGDASCRAITYERGVEDFTLACGTGSGATALSLSVWNVLKGNKLDVEMPGGMLSISFNHDEGGYKDIYLTGPTAYIE